MFILDQFEYREPDGSLSKETHPEQVSRAPSRLSPVSDDRRTTALPSSGGAQPQVSWSPDC